MWSASASCGVDSVIRDTECPACDGEGRVLGSIPNRRARFVNYDDLSPDDYENECDRCGGTGVIEVDLNEEAA